MRVNKNLVKKDKDEFKRLYETYFHEAYRVASAITKSRELAKEAVQETFIRVYHYIDQYDEAKPFSPWFFRILTNECMRILKKENKVRQISADYDETLDIQSTSKNTLELTLINDAIQQLSELYRIPIILKYLQGFSEKEIANILNLNHNTVKSRLFKGRQILRESLKDFYTKEGS